MIEKKNYSVYFSWTSIRELYINENGTRFIVLLKQESVECAVLTILLNKIISIQVNENIGKHEEP